MSEELKEKLIQKLKSGGKLSLGDCSMCGYPLNFHSDGKDLFFDAGCYCVNYINDMELRNWGDLDFYLTPEHGHIKKIEELVS